MRGGCSANWFDSVNWYWKTQIDTTLLHLTLFNHQHTQRTQSISYFQKSYSQNSLYGVAMRSSFYCRGWSLNGYAFLLDCLTAVFCKSNWNSEKKLWPLWRFKHLKIHSCVLHSILFEFNKVISATKIKCNWTGFVGSFSALSSSIRGTQKENQPCSTIPPLSNIFRSISL